MRIHRCFDFWVVKSFLLKLWSERVNILEKFPQIFWRYKYMAQISTNWNKQSYFQNNWTFLEFSENFKESFFGKRWLFFNIWVLQKSRTTIHQWSEKIISNLLGWYNFITTIIFITNFSSKIYVVFKSKTRLSTFFF